MSSENVEIVRGLFEMFRRGEHERPFVLYDPEIVWENFVPPPPGMEETYRGHDGVRRFWQQWLEPWELVEFEYERVFDAGDEVVVFARMSARGEATGIETQLRGYAQIWTFRDGKVTRMRFYEDRDAALAAAGVRD